MPPHPHHHADGGGAGRDANDDKRIELNEWMAGFTTVADHGFVGLKNVTTTDEARAVFESIDDNGGGIVLLDEWSYWIKQEEIKAGTAIGALLQMDEAGGVGKEADKLKATKKALPGRISAAEYAKKKAKKEAKSKQKSSAGPAAEEKAAELDMPSVSKRQQPKTYAGGFLTSPTVTRHITHGSHVFLAPPVALCRH